MIPNINNSKNGGRRANDAIKRDEISTNIDDRENQNASRLARPQPSKYPIDSDGDPGIQSLSQSEEEDEFEEDAAGWDRKVDPSAQRRSHSNRNPNRRRNTSRGFRKGRYRDRHFDQRNSYERGPNDFSFPYPPYPAATPYSYDPYLRNLPAPYMPAGQGMFGPQFPMGLPYGMTPTPYGPYPAYPTGSMPYGAQYPLMQGQAPPQQPSQPLPKVDTKLSDQIEKIASQLEQENQQLAPLLQRVSPSSIAPSPEPLLQMPYRNNNNNNIGNPTFLDLSPNSFHGNGPTAAPSRLFGNYEDDYDKNGMNAGRQSLDDRAKDKRLTKLNTQYQEELMKLEFDMEKLRRQHAISELQYELEKSSSSRAEENEHEKWLKKQKQQLEELKIQQVLVKEKRLLNLQLGQAEEGGAALSPNTLLHENIGSIAANNADKSDKKSTDDASPISYAMIAEQSGVGTIRVPIDLVEGFLIIVDGIYIPKSCYQGRNLLEYRIALGIFDSFGKSVVRLSASSWELLQDNSNIISNNNSGNNNNNNENVLIELDTNLKRMISKINPSMHSTLRCLLELQMRSEGGGQVAMGWNVFPIFVTVKQGILYAQVGLDRQTDIFLNNGLWRSPLRKGSADPKSPFSEITEANRAAGFILLRIIESKNSNISSRWKMKQSRVITEANIMSIYLDPFSSLSTMGVGGTSAREDDDLAHGRNSRLALHAGLHAIGAIDFMKPEVKPAGGSPLAAGSGLSPNTAQVPKTATTDALGAADGKLSRSRPTTGAAMLSPAPSSKRNSLVDPNTIKTGTASMERKLSIPSAISSQSLATESEVTLGGAASPLRSSFRRSSLMLNQSARSGLDVDGARIDVIDNSSSAGLLIPLAEIEEERLEPSASQPQMGWWIAGTPAGSCRTRYEQGDGIDIYVDGARFLPDNCTLTRCVVKIMSREKETLGPTSFAISQLASFSLSPTYNHRHECRMPIINTTSTLLIRIDTLDYNLQACGVGYAAIKLFTDIDRRLQPKDANAIGIYLNSGFFQIPIYRQRFPTVDFFDENSFPPVSRIPCASLLVRIYAAPKSPDGLSILSQRNSPQSEWSRLGLNIPAPNYINGNYDGSACKPNQNDIDSYMAKLTEPDVSVEEALSSITTSQGAMDIPLKPTQTNEFNEWLGKYLPAPEDMRSILDYTLCVPFHQSFGIQVSIEMLLNMPDGGLLATKNFIYKVIYSVTPPAFYYRDPPLSDGVHMTIDCSLDSSIRQPVFLDGYKTFMPTQLFKTHCLVLEIRTIKVEGVKKEVI